MPTTNVTITDYLPAGLEFLGCGNVDNSKVVTEEYPGSGPLGTPPVNPADCLTPNKVETVENPPGVGSGVYTAVTWTIASLAVSDVQKIRYVAGIPMKANTMQWAGATPDLTGAQGSNLDNNNGPSTREGIPERSLTNKVRSSGTFESLPSQPVQVNAEHTVTIEDIRMQKGVVKKNPADPAPQFEPGEIVTFKFTIQASEYMDGAGIAITDTLPDGYCPLSPTTDYWPGAPDSLCAAGAATTPTISTDSAAPVNTDYIAGTQWNVPPTSNYTVKYPDVTVSNNKETVVTLPARMLRTYRGTGDPTLAGDSFRNTVNLDGKTTAINDSNNQPVETPNPVDITDDSAYTLSTTLPVISKKIKPRAAPPDFPGGMKCGLNDLPDYVSDPNPLPQFRLGDVICFKLRVDFPANITTKGAIVTDFPPVDTAFVTDNNVATGNNKYALTANNNVNAVATLTADKLQIELGDSSFVGPGNKVFEATFAVQVLKPGTGTRPKIAGNLMKMRTVNTAGEAQSYRDEANYDLLPPPDVAIDKGVIATDKPSATYPPVNNKLQDNKPIEQGGTATFQINVKNRNSLPGANYSVRGIQVWDNLPLQLRCAAVDMTSLKYIPPGGTETALPGGIATCDDGADATKPSILKWVFPSPDLTNTYSIEHDEMLGLIYKMKVPDVAAAGTNYANTAGVRQYEAFTDIPEQTATYIPAENIDPTQDAEANAPKAKDPSNVFIPGVVMAKTGETSLIEDNNNKLTEATIGEIVTYTYSVTIKKGTSVYRGVLSDDLPTGFTFDSFISLTLDGTPLNPLPPDFVLDTTKGELKFPDTYVNNTNADQKFEIKATASVDPAAAGCFNATCTLPQDTIPLKVPARNTAKFVSYPIPVGGTATTSRANYTVDVVQPEPSITKTASPTSVTSTATDITYTVTARTPANRPPLHDVTVIDCIPNTLTVKPGSIDPTGTLANVATCGTDLAITWTFDPLAPGVDKVLTYKANIKPGSPADVKFENTVGMSATSMPGTVTGERTYLTGANADVFITGASFSKTVNPKTATIGQTVTYTAQVKLPDAEYPNVAVADTMPTHISVAPGSFNTVSVKCQQTTKADYTDLTDCSTPNIGYNFLQPVGQKLSWALNTLPNPDRFRVITITYTARVTKVDANKAGETRTNSAVATYGYATQPTTIADLDKTSKPIGTANDSFVIVEPSVTIDKTVNDTTSITVLPDDTFEYKVTVTNANTNVTSTAFNVKVEDAVPTGVTPSLISDSGTFSAGKITWPAIASLAPGASKIFTYRGKLAGNTTTKQTNTAKVTEYSSLPPDPNNPDIRKYGPVDDSADVTPVLPDVKIEKSASKDLAYINEPYTWTIKVTNPSKRTPAPTAYAVAVNDALPPNWTYKANSSVIKLDTTDVSKEPTVTPATGADPEKLLWSNIADLPANSQILITFQAIPGPDVVTTPGVGIGIWHINHANTTWYPGKPTDGWSTTTSPNVQAQTQIASADLALEKSHVTDYKPPLQAQPNQVIPGTGFKWKMVVTNNGLDTSHGPFVLVDTLPPGNTYVGWEGTGWTGCVQDPVNTQKITCTHPDLPDGLGKDKSLEPLFLIVDVDLDAPPSMKNTATVTGRTFDPNLINNTATDEVFSRPQANLALEKTSSGKYIVGEQVEYTLAVTNLGPSTARAPITVTDTLPDGLSVVSYDAGPWQCSPASGATTKVTCTLNQDILPKTQAPLIKILVDVVESPGPTAKNCAVAGSPTEDQVPENNTACVTDPVTNEVQLGISKKTTGANPVFAGESTEFTVTVTNLGPSEAKNVVMTDTLEAGLKATSATGKGWTCDVGTGTTVTCTRKTFPVKASPSDIVIKANVGPEVRDGTTLKNVATVTTTTPQPGGDPPPAISDVVVRALSDLAIVKTHRKQPWTIGKQGRWYLSVTNNGPSNNAGPITVTDTLPRGTSYVSASGSDWTCDGSQRFFTCTLAAGLSVGQTSSEITVLVDVVEGAWPSVLNTATVTSPWPDPKPDNNTATDEVPVERSKQTIPPRPPGVVKGGKTDQGQKIRTKVRCLPMKASAAGEVSYCKVIRKKNGVIKIKVIGPRPMRAIVTQYAKGTKNYKPWKKVTRFVVRP